MTTPESSPADNPYTAPRADLGPMAAVGIGDPEAETIRREMRRAEGYVKAVGIAHFAYAAFCLLCEATFIDWVHRYRLRVDLNLLESHPLSTTGLFLMPVLVMLSLAIGLGLCRLRRWAARLAAFQLVLFAGYGGWQVFSLIEAGQFYAAGITLLISLSYFLITFGLWGPDGEYVVSEEYRGVVRDTPHLRVGPRLPVGLTLGLVVIVLTIGTLIALEVMATIRREATPPGGSVSKTNG